MRFLPHSSSRTVVLSSGGGKGVAKRACAPGGTVQGAAFGGEFRNSTSGELTFVLHNGFGGFVSRLQ